MKIRVATCSQWKKGWIQFNLSDLSWYLCNLWTQTVHTHTGTKVTNIFRSNQKQLFLQTEEVSINQAEILALFWFSRWNCFFTKASKYQIQSTSYQGRSRLVRRRRWKVAVLPLWWELASAGKEKKLVVCWSPNQSSQWPLYPISTQGKQPPINTCKIRPCK